MNYWILIIKKNMNYATFEKSSDEVNSKYYNNNKKIRILFNKI